MDRILSTYSYGICLFSMEVLQDFLKKEKIRSKKLLHKFQKDKKLYLAEILNFQGTNPILGMGSLSI